MSAQFATRLGSGDGVPMITLVPSEGQYQRFLSAHWPHVSPDLFVPESDANATFRVTPDTFSLDLRFDDGKMESVESEHDATVWAQACLMSGRVLVFVGPPGLDVDSINDKLLVEEAQRGKLFGAYVPARAA